MIVKVFGVINLVSGLVTLLMGLYILSRAKKNKLPFLAPLFLFASWWNIALFFESFSDTLEMHIFWTTVSYPGNMFAPVFLFLFIYHYTHYHRKINHLRVAALMIIPLLSCLFVWHPGMRGIVWPNVSLNATPWGNIARLDHGWWYYVEAYYSYLLVGLGIFYLLRGFAIFPQAYTKQVRLILISSLLPLLLNFVYTLNSSHFYGYDLTSLAFSFSTILFYLAIAKYQLLLTKPVAWDTIIESFDEGVIALDNNRIVGFNSAAKKILTLINIDCRVGLPITETMGFCKQFIEFYNNTTLQRFEFRIEEQFFEITKNQIQGQASEDTRITLIFHNISDIKKKEAEIQLINEKLIQTNATKDMLFKVISHDLRGPMGTIVSYLRMLVESGKTIDIKKLEILYDTSANAYFLIENLLYWAIGQGSRLSIQPTVISLSNLISRSVETVRVMANQKDLAIRINCQEDTCVFFDSHSIEIVLRNLLSNAVKFSFPGQEILVSARKDMETVILDIVDQGKGMDEETIRKIKENDMIKSQRGTFNESGTGIGLPLCMKLISANEGSLDIISGKEKGTTIRVTLPAAECMKTN